MNILRTHRCNIEFDKGDDSMITNRSRFAIKFTLKMFCSNIRTVFCLQSLVVSYKFVVLVFRRCFFAEHEKMTFFSLMKLHFILSFHFMVYQEKHCKKIYFYFVEGAFFAYLILFHRLCLHANHWIQKQQKKALFMEPVNYAPKQPNTYLTPSNHTASKPQ